MIRISLVVPYHNFIRSAYEIFSDHCKTNVSSEQYELEEIIVDINSLETLEINSDAVIARGLYAEILKKRGLDIPVIEISVPSSDLIKTIKKAKNYFGNKKVGVIAPYNMLYGAEELVSVVDKVSSVYILHTGNDNKYLVEKAVEDGCEIIVGSRNACLYAELLGVRHKYIETSKNSFWQCLTIAKETLSMLRAENLRLRRLSAILDNSNDGIITINLEKKIEVINKQAMSLLGMNHMNTINKSIFELSFEKDFLKLISDEEEYSNKIIRYRGTSLSVNKSFFSYKEIPGGCVITLKNTSDIQEAEHTIRKQLLSSGYCAKKTFEDIIYESPLMAAVVNKAKYFSRTDANILITGATGCGKEIFAQSIHNASQRAEGAFVAVNCAAIPENLLESELFGYGEGAFTGSRKGGKTGLFELAHKGTLFLDEIGDLPLQLQSKLLRAIQEKEIMRLGDGRITPVDIRILTATNIDLEEQVRKGRFREDLFYRVDILRISIPALNDRKEDIVPLAENFIQSHFRHIEIEKKALKLLEDVNWHGNVRQLFNICERLCILARDKYISESLVQEVLMDAVGVGSGGLVSLNRLEEKEMEELLTILEKVHFNKTKAAELMGMSRSTLWRKMVKYNIS